MVERRAYYLDGSKMKTKDEFFDEVQRIFCPAFKHFERNLDAFDEILRGGFGIFGRNEPIVLYFKNHVIAKKHLGEDFYNKILGIIRKHDHIILSCYTTVYG